MRIDGASIELITGGWVVATMVAAWYLDEKRQIPFPLTYLWGAAIGYGLFVVVSMIATPRDIDAVNVLMALLLVGFAAYVTGRGRLS